MGVDNRSRAEVGQQSSIKADQNKKAKNDEFEVPFDLVVAAGFGGVSLSA